LERNELPEPFEVFEVKEPHITVILYENLLKIDLRGSFKNEIEEALENKPVLKETFGNILGMFVPLHIRLSDINSVHMDETGKIKVKLSLHRNIVIPLERNDAEKLVHKLNQLISIAKKKNLEHIVRKRARQSKRRSKKSTASSYVSVPYYFPTEQVDIVNKLQSRKKRRKK
jgi:hypothetical protein